VKIDGFVKSKNSPSRLGVTGGMNEKGIDKLVKFHNSSPSPSPVKGEGVTFTFYKFIKIAR
jgi:hypothetical protein